MPENQTQWNSNNHGIKETVKENNQTGKVVNRGGETFILDLVLGSHCQVYQCQVTTLYA